jgi:hypothetical protein
MLLLCMDASVMLGEDEKGANLHEVVDSLPLPLSFLLHSFSFLSAFENFFPVRVDEIVKSLDIRSFQPQSERRLFTLLTMCVDGVSR